MQLQTIKQVAGGTLTITTENKPPITDKIRLTNKAKQSAQNKAAIMPDAFMKLAAIERKKENKKAFFAKHKNK